MTQQYACFAKLVLNVLPPKVRGVELERGSWTIHSIIQYVRIHYIRATVLPLSQKQQH